jgi:hypothetical protein
VTSVVVACGFPDVQYLPADSGGDSAWADAASTPDASEVVDGGTDTSVPGLDAAVGVDGLPSSDAIAADTTTQASSGDGAPIDGPSGAEASLRDTGSDGSSCDQDGDLDLAPGTVCGGNDCDDHDARAYWGEPDFLKDLPTLTTKGDWNCDHIYEHLFRANVNCGVLGALACNATQGFIGSDPGCGMIAPFVQCQVSGLLCTAVTSMQTQMCR